MIKSFKHKGLKEIFRHGRSKLINAEHWERIAEMLDELDAAVVVLDLALPGYDFHGLQGKRKGEYSVAVRANWKITFRFEDGDAYIVNYEDYH